MLLEESFLYHVTLLVFFCYNVFVIDYCKKALIEYNKHIMSTLLCAAINTIAVTIYLQYGGLHNYFYLIVFIGFFIEFKLLSKSPIRQILFVSSSLVFHIALINVPLIIGFSKILSQYPLYILTNLHTRLISISALCIILATALFIMKMFISREYLKRLSLAKNYSILISVTSLFCMGFYTILSYFLITTENYPEQFFIAIMTSTFLFILFYFTLLYAMNFINMTMYKRHSDKAEMDYSNMISRKKEVLEKIIRDGLTGLFNKEYILDEIKELKNSDRTFAVLFIDVNLLKSINDEFGHDNGDKLIILAANTIKVAIRDQDIAARVSGDEFVVLLKDLSRDDLTQIIDRTKHNAIVQENLYEFPFYLSVGGVFVDEELRKKEVQEILDVADAQMMKEKKAFYNKYNQKNQNV